MLTYHRTTEEEKYSITNWKYEGKYRETLRGT